MVRKFVVPAESFRQIYLKGREQFLRKTLREETRNRLLLIRYYDSIILKQERPQALDGIG